LQVSGGIALTAVTPAAVLALDGEASAATTAAPAEALDGATGPMPSAPVVAYVHDAERGEVTVLSGTQETTYRDPELARRLLDAARRHTS
jgi:3-hydroxyisobutyrate dehydrogenase-like beta-hydroxyacid dehydrogenase